MSISTIPESVKLRLWGKAAGRCQYEGCNQRLWLDSLTKAEFNSAYIAHIVADSPDGPRGHPELSEKLKADITNLMLLCDSHHRLVDRDGLKEHPVERLQFMKAAHERRIDLQTDVSADKQSHVLLYGANVGSQPANPSFVDATRAMSPERYPAETTPLRLGLANSSFEDTSPEFWRMEREQLLNQFRRVVQSRLSHGGIPHLSIFALAPQPLLILLGSLLTDIPAADVYQLHREPPTWRWGDEQEAFGYIIQPPATFDGAPALTLALSATISDARVFKILGEKTSIWKVTIPEPNNDFLKSRKQAEKFRTTMRSLLDNIKAHHGEAATIHVFPAMPVALAVEFGRVLMPKADLPLQVYDENKRLGGFVAALNINPRTA